MHPSTPTDRVFFFHHRWVRAVLVLAALLVALVAYCYARLRSDEHRLAEVVAAIRARGEPLLWRDFAGQPLPPERNAATFHRQALDVLGRAFCLDRPAARPDPNSDRLRGLFVLLRDDPVLHPPLRTARAADIREALSLCRQIAPLCRRARQCERAEWVLAPSGPAATIDPPGVSRVPELATLLCLEAVAALEAGREAEAVELLRDAMAVGRSIGSVPSLTCFQASVYARRSVWSALEQLAPRLRAVGAGGDARPAATGLIDDLLADAPFARAMMGRRACVYDLAERIRLGRLPLSALRARPGGVAPAMRGFHLAQVVPALYVGDEIELLARMDRHVRAAAAGSFPEAQRRRREPLAPAGSRAPGPLAVFLMPRYAGLYEEHFRDRAMCRMAAIRLAMRLCELDRGLRPARLAELVPAYLPAVPADPFADDARPIGCAPGAATPVLYSVYEDGTDDGGRYGTEGGYVLLRLSADLVFFLNGDRPDGD